MTKFINTNELNAQIQGLLAKHPELQEDEDLLLDTLEGETDFNVAIARLLGSVRNAETMSDAIKERIEVLRHRKARYERKSDSIRGVLKSLMTSAGVKSLQCAEASLSISKGFDRVEVEDVEQLPQGYFKIEKKADKTAIKSAIKAGEEIPGAYLEPGKPSLTIRTK